MNQYSMWESAQWWTSKPERVQYLGLGGKVSIVLIHVGLFVFSAAAMFVTHSH